jgi:hypothetical protein
MTPYKRVAVQRDIMEYIEMKIERAFDVKEKKKK